MPLSIPCSSVFGVQEAEAAAIASAAELEEIRAKATFILQHMQPPVSIIQPACYYSAAGQSSCCCLPLGSAYAVSTLSLRRSLQCSFKSLLQHACKGSILLPTARHV